jgi:hypothetical protein
LGNVADTTFNTTAELSHELVEAATDPSVSTLGGWYDTSPIDGEIGDICDNMKATPGGLRGVYALEPYWSKTDNGCVTPGSDTVFVSVPRVKGMPLAKARDLLLSRGFYSNVEPVVNCDNVGIVLGQAPSDTQLPQGSLITLTVGQKPTRGNCP